MLIREITNSRFLNLTDIFVSHNAKWLSVKLARNKKKSRNNTKNGNSRNKMPAKKVLTGAPNPNRPTKGSCLHKRSSSSSLNGYIRNAYRIWLVLVKWIRVAITKDRCYCQKEIIKEVWPRRYKPFSFHKLGFTLSWSIFVPLIDPLLSKIKIISFGMCSSTSGDKKWTKYPFTTWNKRNQHIHMYILTYLTDQFHVIIGFPCYSFRSHYIISRSSNGETETWVPTMVSY